jgi:multiple sugar transport system substrate-binding protein
MQRSCSMYWLRFLLVLLIVVGVSHFAAAKTTITLLAGNVNENIWSAALASFERDNPDIEVEPIFVAWDAADDKFVTMVAGGSAPDVFLQNSVYGWPTYAYKGLLLDLSPLVNKNKDQIKYQDVLPVGWNNAMVGGRLSGFAGLSSGFGVRYNATLFEEAGLSLPPTDWNDTSWNWNTMVDYARKVTVVNSDGQATCMGVDFWDADNLIGYAWAFGGDWFSPESYPTGVVDQVTLVTPQNIEAYEALASLKAETGVRPGGRIPSAFPIGGANSFFTGNVGMWIDATELVSAAKNPAVADFKWGLAPFPFPVNGKREGTFSWSGAYAGISADSRHPDEAWRLIAYLTADTTDQAVRDASYMNPRRSFWMRRINDWLSEGLSALGSRELQQVTFGALERALPLPRVTMVGADEVWKSVQQFVVPALGGRTSVKGALEQAQSVAEGRVVEYTKQNVGGN